MPRRILPPLLAFALLFASTTAHAHDYFFPDAGHVGLRASTGVPFAAAGEVSVGVVERLAVGALVAAGPFQGGIAWGLYPRVDVVHLGPTRLTLETALLWYPGIGDAENWILVRPVARIEGVAGRVRVHAAFGALIAKMVGAEPVTGPIAPYGGAGLPSGVQHGAAWNTWGIGSAVAITARTSIFGEAFVMTRGVVALAGPEWFQIPAAAMLGVSTSL